uniref:Apple domain-containing protein n=1 Tax=Macrostomum lignano TaxID=282301 RepID=A0A1I8FCC1_9PLAT
NDPGSCANQKLFSLAQPHSLTCAPVLQVVCRKLASELQCSLQCRAQSGVCFGFYWQEASLSCQLFSIAAFFSKSLWQPSDKPVDVFTKSFDSIAVTRIKTFTEAHCTHTDGGDFQCWWQADLAQQSASRQSASSTGRTAAMRGSTASPCCVDDIECARVDVAQSSPSRRSAASGYGSRGSLINRLNTYVSLCEVEVLALPPLRCLRKAINFRVTNAQ